MEFNYGGTFFIEENDLKEMCELCKDKGYSPLHAFREVSSGWDDCDYYISGLVEDEVVEELKRRLREEK